MVGIPIASQTYLLFPLLTQIRSDLSFLLHRGLCLGQALLVIGQRTFLVACLFLPFFQLQTVVPLFAQGIFQATQMSQLIAQCGCSLMDLIL